MSKSLVWVAAFVGAFVFLFFLQKLTKTEKSSQETMPGGMQTQTEQTESSATDPGEALISKLNCGRCHGTDLKGTAQAPSLMGLAGNYKRDDLINYLRNPKDYMDKERYQVLKSKYANKIMPAFGDQDTKDLGKISDYLLKLK